MEIIFLTYINRSGSTYLANLLSSSGDIIAFPEAEILVELFLEDPGRIFQAHGKHHPDHLKQIFNNDPKLRHWQVEPEVFHSGACTLTNYNVFIRILSAYRDRIKPGASVFLFKAERIIHLIRKIRKVPDAVRTGFVAIIRDPRAVYASQKRTFSPLNGTPLSTDPVYTAMQWRKFADFCRLYEKLRAFNMVRYENLILSESEVVKNLCGGLDLDPKGIRQGRCDLFERIPADHQVIHGSILKGPVTGKTDEWKEQLTEKEIRLIELTAGKQMDYFGYRKIFPRKFTAASGIVVIKKIGYFVGGLIKKTVFHIRHSI